MRSRVRLASPIALAAALLASSAVFAQTPPVPRDSATVHDSAATDSAVHPAPPRPRDAHALQAALYAVVIAPALLVAIIPDSGLHGSPLGYSRDHFSLYLTAGLASGRRGPILGASWTGSGSIEMLRRGILVEARLEQFQLVEHVEYRTLRVGRMSRPHARTIGGVTLGYRSAPGLRAHEGVELAFPFVGGGRANWWRFETAYVLSTAQSTWNYRLQVEHRVARSPFTLGCNMDLKSWAIRKHGELSHGNFAIVMGTTFDRR